MARGPTLFRALPWRSNRVSVRAFNSKARAMFCALACLDFSSCGLWLWARSKAVQVHNAAAVRIVTSFFTGSSQILLPTFVTHFCYPLLLPTFVTHFCYPLLLPTSVTHFCYPLLLPKGYSPPARIQQFCGQAEMVFPSGKVRTRR